MKNVKFKVQTCVVVDGSSYRTPKPAAYALATSIAINLKNRANAKVGYAAYHVGRDFWAHREKAFRRVFPIIKKIFEKE